MNILSRRCISALTASLLLFGCGGGGGGGGGTGISLVGSPTGPSGTGGQSDGGQGNGGQSNGGEVAGNASGGGTGGTSGGTAPVPATVALADKLGKPSRVLVGLGATSIDDMKIQDIHPDIVERYLVGVGPGSWPTWNSPDGAYVTFTAQAAQAYGAVPMFTLYQMTANGEGNLSGISDKTFMDKYWGQVRLMYQRIAELDKPALVNVEPDFWGFAASQAPGRDLTKMAAAVNGQPECSTLPDTVAGLGQCFVQMGRKVAPKALIGFPPAFWNGTPVEIAAMMRAAGANQADFIVAQTSDRDAGCREAASPPPECQNGSAPFYWDASNKTSPNFHDSQKQYSDYRTALGNGLPILWWQTPMGVPSDTPGGTDQHYRDNHVDYMLNNTQEYGDMHTIGIVFSPGGSHQTSINTDGGQFARLSAQYLARGGAALK
ncbi:hypothetical protein EH244_22780 [Variovorax beijingensis]|uniref:Uncharacterized protein n=2 Tax=Variovorax beijingensis TaxID=2496117 RepID=A0A3P3EGN5_9BURK|nr:hypothetical protein [Variovorax beijingensis]RRH85564.1 hypothetical protein EH244_22780 [Variovorax beijingensis]